MGKWLEVGFPFFRNWITIGMISVIHIPILSTAA
jgi:hypothetical protein